MPKGSRLADMSPYSGPASKLLGSCCHNVTHRKIRRDDGVRVLLLHPDFCMPFCTQGTDMRVTFLPNAF